MTEATADPILKIFPPTEAPPREERLPVLSFYGTARLRAQRKAMQEAAYKRAFEATAFADKDLYFPHFQTCMDYYKGTSLNDWSPAEKALWWTVAGVDLSSDKRPGTVIYVMSVLPDTRKITRLIWRGQWDSPTICRMIQRVDDKLRPRIWAVEDNGFQRSLREWARALAVSGLKIGGKNVLMTWSRRVRAFTTGANKTDPETGLRGMDLDYENFGWIYPGADAPAEFHPEGHQCPGCVWKEESRLFPHHKRTDSVMSQWFAWETAISRCPYLKPRPPQEEPEPEEEESRVIDESGTTDGEIYGMAA